MRERVFISSWSIFRNREKAVRIGRKLKLRAERKTGFEHLWLVSMGDDGMVLVKTDVEAKPSRLSAP